MTASRFRWLSLAVMFALVLVAAPARAADVDGRWTGSIDTPTGAIQLGFSFKADGAVLSGSMTGMDGAEIPIKNGKIDGNRISFVVSVDFGGMMFDLNYTGVVGKDSVEMASDFMGMPFTFTLKKAQKRGPFARGYGSGFRSGAAARWCQYGYATGTVLASSSAAI
jgi:hypothetical protein